MKLQTYRGNPEAAVSTAVIAPYPYGGNHENSLDRYTATAKSVGVDIIGFPRFGTGPEVKGLTLKKIRNMIARENISKLCEDLAEVLEPKLQNYDRVISMADSTANYTMAPFILSQLVKFDAAQVRDGVNLKAPQKPVLGELSYFAYQFIVEKNKPEQPKDELLTMDPVSPGLDAILSGVKEAVVHGQQWRGTDGMDMTKELAALADLPLHVVSLEHTFTGSFEQAYAFGNELVTIRNQKIAQGLGDASLVLTFVEGAYHSAIERPTLAVAHLKQTMSMASLRA